MGLFDRWLKAGRNDVNNISASAAARAEQDATRKLEEGMALEKQGQWMEAVQSYDAAIRLMPKMARAHFNRGNILLDRGDSPSALAAYAEALKYKPESAATHYNIGNAHLRLGHSDEGIAACRRAIALKPDFAEAYVTLGVALEELRQHDDAIACYRRALEIKPDSTEVHNNLAIALQDLGRLDEAVVSYRQALHFNPKVAKLHNNLGSALKELGKLDEAMASYSRALEIDPDLAEAHYNLGVCLQAGGQLERAVACYRRTLEINADYALAYTNLGAVLGLLGQYEATLACFRRVIELQPNNSDGHRNLGITLATIGQLDSAMASYRKALAIQPDNADTHLSLGGALKDYGQFEAALKSIRRAIEIRPDYAMAHSNLLFIHNYLGDQPAALTLDYARHFGEMALRLARPYTAWPNPANPERLLRVGFVSGDLCNHPVGYFLESVLAALSSQASTRLELYAYSNRDRDDSTSQHIQACCRSHSVALLSDEALARRIRDDGIDILIDLSGHTAHNRLTLFAWKPAPVQVSWLGYFATTGVAAMDYFIADHWTLAPDQEAYFTEQIWRLPETRLCFTPPDAKVAVSPLPALTNGYITFGCFNNLSKINDAVVALWAQVMHHVPNTRLFLKYQQLAEASVRQSTCERFAMHGIDAKRLIFEDYTPRENYLAAYHRVDIALDPFPFPGGTTTVEALWMGVPVLTLAGERFLSRQGVGLMMNAGLPEWVATDPDDYVARAVSHCLDLRGLAALRAGLRQQVLASPIFDAPRFARNFEAALRGMWQKWCEAQPASDIGSDTPVSPQSMDPFIAPLEDSTTRARS